MSSCSPSLASHTSSCRSCRYTSLLSSHMVHLTCCAPYGSCSGLRVEYPEESQEDSQENPLTTFAGTTGQARPSPAGRLCACCCLQHFRSLRQVSRSQRLWGGDTLNCQSFSSTSPYPSCCNACLTQGEFTASCDCKGLSCIGPACREEFS